MAAAVYGEHVGDGYGVIGEGRGASYAGILGRNPTGPGVTGTGLNGVQGTSSAVGYGAVYGLHTNAGHGVIGDGAGASTSGVMGRNNDGVGVLGTGKTGTQGNSSEPGHGAVYGQHTGNEGYGVVGDASGTESAAMLGRNASGDAVRGQGKTGLRGVSPDGAGVIGEGDTGYGGVFKGVRA